MYVERSFSKASLPVLCVSDAIMQPFVRDPPQPEAANAPATLTADSNLGLGGLVRLQSSLRYKSLIHIQGRYKKIWGKKHRTLISCWRGNSTRCFIYLRSNQCLLCKRSFNLPPALNPRAFLAHLEDILGCAHWVSARSWPNCALFCTHS
jgi:hypothetical protein